MGTQYVKTGDTYRKVVTPDTSPSKKKPVDRSSSSRSYEVTTPSGETIIRTESDFDGGKNVVDTDVSGKVVESKAVTKGGVVSTTPSQDLRKGLSQEEVARYKSFEEKTKGLTAGEILKEYDVKRIERNGSVGAGLVYKDRSMSIQEFVDSLPAGDVVIKEPYVREAASNTALIDQTFPVEGKILYFDSPSVKNVPSVEPAFDLDFFDLAESKRSKKVSQFEEGLSDFKYGSNVLSRIKGAGDIIVGGAGYVAGGVYVGASRLLESGFRFVTKPGDVIAETVEFGAETVRNPKKSAETVTNYYLSDPIAGATELYLGAKAPEAILKGTRGLIFQVKKFQFNRFTNAPIEGANYVPYTDSGVINVDGITVKAKGQRTLFGEVIPTNEQPKVYSQIREFGQGDTIVTVTEKVIGSAKTSPLGLPEEVSATLGKSGTVNILPEGKAGVSFDKTFFDDTIRTNPATGKGYLELNVDDSGLFIKERVFGQSQKSLIEERITLVNPLSGKTYNVPESFVLRRLEENPVLRVKGVANPRYKLFADVIPGTSFLRESFENLKVKYDFKRRFDTFKERGTIDVKSNDLSGEGITPFLVSSSVLDSSGKSGILQRTDNGLSLGSDLRRSTRLFEENVLILRLKENTKNDLASDSLFAQQSIVKLDSQSIQATEQTKISDTSFGELEFSTPNVKRSEWQPLKPKSGKTPESPELFNPPRSKDSFEDAIGELFSPVVKTKRGLQFLNRRLTKEKAIREAYNIVESTPYASFGIADKGGNLVDFNFNSKGFKRSKSNRVLWVEPSSKRINTPGELSGITFSPRNKKRKTRGGSIWE